MPIYSALDAISPAVARTRLILFSPFRFGRTWKLCFTAYLTVAASVFMPMFLLVFFFLPKLRQFGGTVLVTASIITAIVLTFFFAWLFYLCTRLRFAFFDIVLNRVELVSPPWRKYGPQAYQWALFKILLGTVISAAVALPMAAFYHHFFASLSALSALRPGQQPPPELFVSFMSGYFSFYAVFILIFWVSALLSDFIVPSLALESTTLSEAFRRLGQLIRSEPGQFTAYALLKLVLAIAGYMAVTIAFEIAIVIVMIIVGLVVLLIGFLLHLAGVSIAVLTVLGVTLLVAFYCFAFWAMMFGVGTVLTFLEAYALYFLSGRYPVLGELLAASTPPPTTVSPLYPNPYPPYTPPPPVG